MFERTIPLIGTGSQAQAVAYTATVSGQQQLGALAHLGASPTSNNANLPASSHDVDLVSLWISPINKSPATQTIRLWLDGFNFHSYNHTNSTDSTVQPIRLLNNYPLSSLSRLHIGTDSLLSGFTYHGFAIQLRELPFFTPTNGNATKASYMGCYTQVSSNIQLNSGAGIGQVVMPLGLDRLDHPSEVFTKVENVLKISRANAVGMSQVGTKGVIHAGVSYYGFNNVNETYDYASQTTTIVSNVSSNAFRSWKGSGSTTDRGYFISGSNSSGTLSTSLGSETAGNTGIDKYTFASDTLNEGIASTTTGWCNLTFSGGASGFCYNHTGFTTGGAATNAMDKINYSNDTRTAVANFGLNSFGSHNGIENNTYGWMLGFASTYKIRTSYRYQFSSETTVANTAVLNGFDGYFGTAANAANKSYMCGQTYVGSVSAAAKFGVYQNAACTQFSHSDEVEKPLYASISHAGGRGACMDDK